MKPMKFLLPIAVGALFFTNVLMNAKNELCSVEANNLGSAGEGFGIACFAISILFQCLMFFVVGSLNNSIAIGKRIDDIVSRDKSLTNEIKLLWDFTKNNKIGLSLFASTIVALTYYSGCDAISTSVDLQKVCKSEFFSDTTVKTTINLLSGSNDIVTGISGTWEAGKKISEIGKR